MGSSVLKRFLVTLIAFAFISASLPLNCVDLSTMQNAAAMTAAMDNPCSDCLDHAPATDLAKMGCGALTCAGIIGLPARPNVAMPNFVKYLHPSSTVEEMVGISLKPDPLPPKPTVLV